MKLILFHGTIWSVGFGFFLFLLLVYASHLSVQYYYQAFVHAVKSKQLFFQEGHYIEFKTV